MRGLVRRYRDEDGGGSNRGVILGEFSERWIGGDGGIFRVARCEWETWWKRREEEEEYGEEREMVVEGNRGDD